MDSEIVVTGMAVAVGCTGVALGLGFCAVADSGHNETASRRYGRMSVFLFAIACGVVIALIGASYAR